MPVHNLHAGTKHHHSFFLRNESLNQLQAEIDSLQEEQNKRKEAGEERRKLANDRASKRKALIAAQKLFLAKGNEFKAWAEGKAVELKLWKLDKPIEELEEDLAATDSDITQECDKRLSEIAKYAQHFLLLLLLRDVNLISATKVVERL